MPASHPASKIPVSAIAVAKTNAPTILAINVTPHRVLSVANFFRVFSTRYGTTGVSVFSVNKMLASESDHQEADGIAKLRDQRPPRRIRQMRAQKTFGDK